MNFMPGIFVYTLKKGKIKDERDTIWQFYFQRTWEGSLRTRSNVADPRCALTRLLPLLVVGQTTQFGHITFLIHPHVRRIFNCCTTYS